MLLLWPGTVDVILCHSSSVPRWWKTKPLDGTVTMLASIRLASAFSALTNNGMLSSFRVINNSFNKLINQL